MKTRNAIFATTALVATLAAAGVAIAHPGMGRGMGTGPATSQQAACPVLGHGQECPHAAGSADGTHHGRGPGMHGSAAAANLDDLKTTLKITASQESAWNRYAAVVTRHVEARDNMHEKMQARFADSKATAPDHSAMHETMLKFRQEMQTQRSAALKDLYAVLTPEQKTLADQNLNGMRGHGMGGRMGHVVGHRMGRH